MQQARTITVNGKPIEIAHDLHARAVKRLAGISNDRVLIVQRQDGSLQRVRDDEPLPAPIVVDAPNYIYG
jgi:hypothetical protein